MGKFLDIAVNRLTVLDVLLYRIHIQIIYRFTEELKAFDLRLAKEMFGSQFEGGLLSLLEGMTWQFTESLKKTFLYPRLTLWPQEMRDEVFSLLKYDKFYPEKQNTFKIPDFENIDGDNFKRICEKSGFLNYCKLVKQIPDIGDLFKVLKMAGTTGIFKSDEINLRFGKLTKSSQRSSSKHASVPMCWFGNKTGIYINTPEMTVLQSIAYYLYNKTSMDEVLVSTQQVIAFVKLDRGVESSTISFINFSVLGSNNRFFDKLYDGSRPESSIYIAKIT